MEKSIIIIGATSGIGEQVAKNFHQKGYKIGILGRRIENLISIKQELKENVFYRKIDVTKKESIIILRELIEEMNGVETILICSGFGRQNKNLDPEIEEKTLETNALGFTRIIGEAYRYFSEKGFGHIAAISSIAGTKGLGASPSYSSTKRFESHYMQCLSQLSRINNKKITFTDIRPEFVDTDFLNGNYPMLMKVDKVAKIITRAIINKKRVKIIDWRYSILVFFWKLIPNFVWERIKVG